jgi:hypothetical protein
METAKMPTTDEWIKKMYLYTMKFYSVTKKNEILSFAGKWMELENIILSEVSQAQKAFEPHVLPHVQIIDLTRAAILWNTGHTKGSLQGRARAKEGNQKLEVDVLTVQE